MFVLQVNRWANIYETTLRLVEDTCYVMSHDEVSVYIARERPDISKAWLRLLSLVQGMDPQKRATGIHTEEDNDNVPAPFVLGYYLGKALSLLVGGAYSVDEPREEKGGSNGQGCAKEGRLPQASSTCGMSDKTDCALQSDDVWSDRGNCHAIPSLAAWLIFECLKTVESCLEPGSGLRRNLFSLGASSSNGSNILTFRKKLFRTSSDRVYRTFLSREVGQVLASHERLAFSRQPGESEETLVQDNDQMDVIDSYDMVPEYSRKRMLLDDNHEINSGRELEAFKILNLVDWPDIEYDVSSQEISFHIPLHRLLSLLLRKALKSCYEETGILNKAHDDFALVSSYQHNFFGHVLKGAHPYGFSSNIMENPLRLRVFCAQVRAGMWRKNGDAAILSCEWYRNVQW